MCEHEISELFSLFSSVLIFSRKHEHESHVCCKRDSVYCHASPVSMTWVKNHPTEGGFYRILQVDLQEANH